MGLPNATHGGPVHSDRQSVTEYNKDGTSRARFAQAPSSEEWVINHAQDERQCAATGYQVCNNCGTECHQSSEKCLECGSTELEPTRCRGIAVENKMTCGAHGGNFKPSPQHIAAMRRGTIKTGLNFNEVMYCPCSARKETCSQQKELQDADGVDRCIIEQQMIDSMSAAFIDEYELDDVSDMLMLSRLTMTMVRIARAENNIIKYGELIERSRSSPTGVEIWMEASPSTTIVNQLDSRLQAWLKSLAVSRDSRANLELTSTKVDIAKVLSGESNAATITLGDSYET
ncbi:hypothetical protein KAR91_59600 [Candidatus Pacearchaeota archaeon]|nr:hypothetical protein [Candidatus Pacearchaeota archaeon]